MRYEVILIQVLRLTDDVAAPPSSFIFHVVRWNILINDSGTFVIKCERAELKRFVLSPDI